METETEAKTRALSIALTEALSRVDEVVGELCDELNVDWYSDEREELQDTLYRLIARKMVSD